MRKNLRLQSHHQSRNLTQHARCRWYAEYGQWSGW